MNNILVVYTIYLLCTITLTIWVARTLFKNGEIFLIDIFHGNKPLADAVNNLLLVGFYLVNIGYVVYALKTTELAANAREIIEVLSVKIGFIILMLGGMHFFNMYVFFRLRKRALAYKAYNRYGYDGGNAGAAE